MHARRLVSRGDHDRALTLAQQGWDSDPVHESTVGVIIEIHIADGNRAQALSVYDAFERHLAAAVVGFGPSEVLRALVPPLLAGRPRS